MKKGKRLLILIAVVAVFGVGAYLLNLSAKEQEAAKEAATESAKVTLLTTSADDVTGLTFTHGDQTVALAKQDDKWVYTPRESFALDSTKVENLLGDLKTVESIRTVADTNDSNTEYGLAAPSVIITVTDKDGKAQKISIGDKNTSNGNYYAAVDGKTGIYTISSDLYNAFSINLTSLLTDEAFPSITGESVTGVDWATNQEQHSLQYYADGNSAAYSSAIKWFEKNADGTQTPVNSEAINTLLSSATAITYKGTAADTKADLVTYGLDHPQLTLTLHYTEQVPQSQVDAAKAAEAAAAATAIPTVSPTATPAVTAEAAASTAPVVTDAATVTATVAATAKETATATLAPSATPTTVPTATAKSALSSAFAEDASAVPTATATAAPTTTPEPTVPVERTLTIWLGNLDSDGNVYMTHNQTDRIFTVSSDTLTALLKLSAQDLRNDQPLQLNVSDITGATITLNGVTKTITTATASVTSQSGDQTTQIVYQVDGKDMKTSLFSFFANTLKAIKAEAYTDTPVVDGAQPLLTATFSQNRAGFESIPVAFYAYDESFDQVVVNGDATMLINKRDVSNLQTYFDQMVGTEATATPEIAATTAP